MNSVTQCRSGRISSRVTFAILSTVMVATGLGEGSPGRAATQRQYTVVDLGGPSGLAHSITNSGRIIGSTTFANGSRDAAFWPTPQSPGIDLGTLPGFAGSRGFGINRFGEMVGAALPTIEFTAPLPVYWASCQSAPMELPGVPTGFSGLAPSINAGGQIVGTIYSGDTQSAVSWPDRNTAPIYLTPLGDNFPFGGAFSVNQVGNIFGDTCDANFVECHALFWASSASAPVALASPGGDFIYTDVGGLSTSFLTADGLNNAGQMVGYAYNADFSETRAVVWSSSSSPAVILSTSDDFSNGTAESISENGVIVGTAFNSDFSDAHAFVWRNSHTAGIDLNTLIPSDSGWELLSAESVNNRGEICGQGFLDGLAHAYVLIPVRH